MSKGQKISKAIYGILNSTNMKEKTKKNQPNSTMIPRLPHAG